MKLWDIAKKVGAAVISTAVPGGPVILAAANAMLPMEAQLPETATGDQLIETVQRNLPPEQQLELWSREFDVEIEEIRSWTEIQSTLAQADAAGASTRPHIALVMAYLVAFEVAVVVCSYAYAIVVKDATLVKSITDGWPFIVGAIATPTALLRAYFGMRTKEKKARYSAAANQPINALAPLIDMIKRK